MTYDYMINDVILKRCNDIVIAIGIKSIGDLIPVKSTRDFDKKEDLTITKSAFITAFQDVIKKIGQKIGESYEYRVYEDYEYLGCKSKNIEDIDIGLDKFFYDLKIASKSEGAPLADELDSMPISLDYNINRLTIGSPSLDEERGIQKRVELFFQHLDVKLIYFDNFSKEDKDIIEKMHCRLLDIIESVDCLNKLCFYPRYDLNISLNKNVSPDAEKKILEDIDKLNYKMYLRAQSKDNIKTWIEDRHILTLIRVFGECPQPVSYQAMVKTLRNNLF